MNGAESSEPLLPAADCHCEICTAMREAAEAAGAIEQALSLTAEQDAPQATQDAARAGVGAGEVAKTLEGFQTPAADRQGWHLSALFPRNDFPRVVSKT